MNANIGFKNESYKQQKLITMDVNMGRRWSREGFSFTDFEAFSKRRVADYVHDSRERIIMQQLLTF